MAYQRTTGKFLPPCDTFFVEDAEVEDEGIFVSRRMAREHAARVNAERQYMLAEELSRTVVEEYQEDILDHMEIMEAETLPDVASIDVQTEIQWFMRPYLLDFLVEAHNAFRLLPETLFLTINLLDRYCSKRIVYKPHYQLVGCSAMLISAKYGDKKDRVPTIKELKAMCCGLYDESMFVQMERHVLQTLGWVIGHPTVDNFLQMVLQEVSYDPEVECMARYLSEIAFYHKDFVSVRPSVMARTSLALARHILNRPIPRQSEWSGRYDTNVLVLLSQHLLHPPSPVLFRKYSTRENCRVANALQEFMARQAAIARHRYPPTPPSEAMNCDQDTEMEHDGAKPQGPMLNTPQKLPHQAPPHGYITPPVTPSGDYSGEGNYVPLGQQHGAENQMSNVYSMLS